MNLDKNHDASNCCCKAVKAEPHFLLFSMSLLPLVLFSVFIPVLFALYWDYMQWQAIKKADQSNISPMLRSLFGIFFMYSLFKRIERCMLTKDNIISKFSPIGLTIISLLIGFVPLLNILVIAFIQKAININNAELELKHREL